MVDFRAHYWIVGGDGSQAYSSAINGYVPASDPGFAAYVGPGSILNEAELWKALASNGVVYPDWMFNGTTFSQPTPTTYTKAQLAAYAADARFRRTIVGIKVTSISSSSYFASDTASRNSIDATYAYMIEAPTATVQWKMMDNSFVTLDKPKTTTVMKDMASFAQSCYTCESTTVTSINGGTITTLAQVDSAFAAVSNVFP
jgi:hypothetical protein